MHEDTDAQVAEVTLSSERIYEGRVVNLRVDGVRLPDGNTSRREVVEHHGAVAIVPLLPDRRVILVKQWRYPIGRLLTEIPAGTLEDGEEPIDCAMRELAEETGYSSGSMTHLVSFYSTPGFCDEQLHVFLATDLVPADATADADEFIELATVEWDEAVAMCLDGRIADAKSIAGILAADRNLD